MLRWSILPQRVAEWAWDQGRPLILHSFFGRPLRWQALAAERDLWSAISQRYLAVAEAR